MQKNSQPLVSVVIPCYNHEKFVQDSIQSVIDQTYENIELIVIDDGSTDSSVQKIQEMVTICQQRFSRFELRYRKNKGLTATLNEALRWIEGEYYIAIASDDLMVSSRIVRQVEILNQNSEYYACSGSQLKIDDYGVSLPDNQQNYILKKSFIKNKKNIFNKSNNIYSPTTMFRASAIKKIGGYNPEIFIEDLYIFYKAAILGMTHYQDTDTFTFYRVHDTNNHKRYIWMHENKVKIMDQFRGEPEYKKIKKLVMLEGFYSVSRYVGRAEGYKIFSSVLKYFYHPYFIVGCFFLIIKR